MATKRQFDTEASGEQPVAKMVAYSKNNSAATVFERVYAAKLSEDADSINVFEIVATANSAVVRIQEYVNAKYNLKVENALRNTNGMTFGVKLFKAILAATKFFTQDATVFNSNGLYFYDIEAEKAPFLIKKKRAEDKKDDAQLCLTNEEVNVLRRESNAMRILVNTYAKFKPSSIASDLSIYFARLLKESYEKQNKEELSALFKANNPLYSGNVLYKFQDIFLARFLGIPRNLIPPAEIVAASEREGKSDKLSWEKADREEGLTDAQNVDVIAFASNIEAFQKRNATLQGYFVNFVSMPVYKKFTQ